MVWLISILHGIATLSCRLYYYITLQHEEVDFNIQWHCHKLCSTWVLAHIMILWDAYVTLCHERVNFNSILQYRMNRGDHDIISHYYIKRFTSILGDIVT